MKKCINCKKTGNYWGVNADKKELATGLCVKCMNTPFPITSVCRADLLEGFTAKQISKMSNYDMKALADKLSDAYMNVFWIDLEILVNDILEDKNI